MTIQMNIAEAKGKLSALVEAALNGEEVTLARNGRAKVRLVPITPDPPVRRLGVLRDLGWSQDVPLEAFAPDVGDQTWIETQTDPA
jgi:prevent-host-death family protein